MDGACDASPAQPTLVVPAFLPLKRKPVLRKAISAKKAAPPRSLARSRSRKDRSTAAIIARPSHALAFREVLVLIERAGCCAFSAVNTELINLIQIRHLLETLRHDMKVSALLTQLPKPKNFPILFLPGSLIRRLGESPLRKISVY